MNNLQNHLHSLPLGNKEPGQLVIKYYKYKALSHLVFIFLAVMAFAISALSSNAAEKKDLAKAELFKQSEFFGDDLFKEMLEMDKRMNALFEAHHKRMQETLKAVEKNNSSNSKSSVMAKEDDEFFYYELAFSGFKKEDIAVAIENGTLTFFAKKEEAVKNKSSNKARVSNFYYSFSLSKYDEATKPDVSRAEGKIIVKLKKLTTAAQSAKK